MPDQERLYYLFNKYIEETANADELGELKALLNNQSYEMIARDRLVSLLRQTEPLPGHSESRWQAILQEIRVERKRPMRRWMAVAAAFLGGAVAIWLITHKTVKMPAVADRQTLQHDRAPGGNVARLTLSDGSTITLDSVQNGVITQQGNTGVTKQSDGRLVYKALDEKTAAVVSNTLSTPRGGQYRLVLPDGSEVWLNAASSITYPTAFTGSERRVIVAGEAYFEISPNPAMPFRVITHAPAGDQEVEVLGTHFNIKAYEDETSLTTTLLEGSIRLRSNGTSTLLSPGQQGQLRPDGQIHLNPEVDLEEVVAWKNGLFHFEQADITEVMRQLARWYDVEVVFEGKLPAGKFDGEIPRNSKLTDVFKILQFSNVHFKVEDRKVTVAP
ncbi:MAG: FecR domain-containing protein [Bacteroidetes bacterium]|nr:FecR domain-containing protein [Bacteroidota bacterium]